MKENIKIIVKMRYIMVPIVAFVFLIAFNYAKDTATTNEITYNDFIYLLEKNQIVKVVITDENLIITPSENNEEYKGKTLYTTNINDENLVSQLRKANVTFQGKNPKNNIIQDIVFSWIFPLAIIYFIWKLFKINSENKYLLAKVKELTEMKDN